ncbi:MAG TPA: hypothetical protein VE261_07355, partial [Gaiellaceae bacterium]|nr:hypothetical protein [Gaiellaceae bacterium]
AALGVVVALLGAGCGGDNKQTEAVLRAFFANSKSARPFSARYPHKPGTLPCTVRVQGKTVNATCSADVTLVKTDRAVITLTEAWNHGALAHTWFFFVRRNGIVESVIQEGSAPSH